MPFSRPSTSVALGKRTQRRLSFSDAAPPISILSMSSVLDDAPPSGSHSSSSSGTPSSESSLSSRGSGGNQNGAEDQSDSSGSEQDVDSTSDRSAAFSPTSSNPSSSLNRISQPGSVMTRSPTQCDSHTDSSDSSIGATNCGASSPDDSHQSSSPVDSSDTRHSPGSDSSGSGSSGPRIAQDGNGNAQADDPQSNSSDSVRGGSLGSSSDSQDAPHNDSSDAEAEFDANSGGEASGTESSSSGSFLSDSRTVSENSPHRQSRDPSAMSGVSSNHETSSSEGSYGQGVADTDGDEAVGNDMRDEHENGNVGRIVTSEGDDESSSSLRESDLHDETGRPRSTNGSLVDDQSDASSFGSLLQSSHSSGKNESDICSSSPGDAPNPLQKATTHINGTYEHVNGSTSDSNVSDDESDGEIAENHQRQRSSPQAGSTTNGPSPSETPSEGDRDQQKSDQSEVSEEYSDESDEAPEEVETSVAAARASERLVLEQQVKRTVRESARTRRRKRADESGGNTGLAVRADANAPTAEAVESDDAMSVDEELSEGDLEEAEKQAKRLQRVQEARSNAQKLLVQRGRIRRARLTRRVGTVDIAVLSRMASASATIPRARRDKSDASKFLARQFGQGRFGRVSSARAARSRR